MWRLDRVRWYEGRRGTAQFKRNVSGGIEIGQIVFKNLDELPGWLAEEIREDGRNEGSL